MVDGPDEREAGGTVPTVGASAEPAEPVDPTEPIAESELLVPGSPADSKVTLPALGYQLGTSIGRGGMGEVLAAFDQRIGREVAIKRMRSPNPSAEATTRVLRDARVQARPDHPAIVPVHELGTDEAGRPYFMMKRLAGRTLGQRIAEGAPQRQLL